MEWEDLTSCYRRCRTPFGWLVEADNGDNISICFVPDPDHQWLAQVGVPENVA